MNKDNILKMMPENIKKLLMFLKENQYEMLQEIRLRTGKPLLLLIKNDEVSLNAKGFCEVQQGYIVEEEDIMSVLKYISGFSLYALEDEIRQGYITIEGGHRVGIAGKTVLEHHAIKTLKYISAVNIRIAHEVLNCSKEIMSYILSRDKVYHTLIVSPPKCGKTTLLRDIIRNLSNGFCGYGPYTIGVVDERSEIAGCYKGIPQNDIGMRTDVLDGCPKVDGMRMLLRSMAPQVIAVDEIGKEEDLIALQEVLSAGVTIICTVHGKDIEDCRKRPVLKELVNHHFFDRIIVLSNRYGPCTVEAILDGTRQMEKLR